MKKTFFVQLFAQLFIMLSAILFLLTACGPTVNQIKPLPPLTVNQQFQKQLTPIPTIPAYRCGAWASQNMPDAHSSLIIYARLTREGTNGLAGITAQAVVHFKRGDVPLYKQSTSDAGGYVTFKLSLAGEQPRLIPATVDVTFNTQNGPTTCTAFFTPR